jgi:hypothetical protein
MESQNLLLEGQKNYIENYVHAPFKREPKRGSRVKGIVS